MGRNAASGTTLLSPENLSDNKSQTSQKFTQLLSQPGAPLLAMVRQRCRNDRTRFDTKGNYVTLFGVLCITTVITYTQAQKSHGFDGVRFISPPFSLDRVSRRFSLPANYFSLIGRVRRFVARKLKLIVSRKRSRERINYTPSSARAGSPRRRNETI